MKKGSNVTAHFFPLNFNFFMVCHLHLVLDFILGTDDVISHLFLYLFLFPTKQNNKRKITVVAISFENKFFFLHFFTTLFGNDI